MTTVTTALKNKKIYYIFCSQQLDDWQNRHSHTDPDHLSLSAQASKTVPSLLPHKAK